MHNDAKEGMSLVSVPQYRFLTGLSHSVGLSGAAGSYHPSNGGARPRPWGSRHARHTTVCATILATTGEHVALGMVGPFQRTSSISRAPVMSRRHLPYNTESIYAPPYAYADGPTAVEEQLVTSWRHSTFAYARSDPGRRHHRYAIWW